MDSKKQKNKRFSTKILELIKIIIYYFLKFKILIPIYVILIILAIITQILRSNINVKFGQVAQKLSDKNLSYKISLNILVEVISFSTANLLLQYILNRISTNSYIYLSVRQVKYILGLNRPEYINHKPTEYIFNIDRCSKGLSTFLEYIITSFVYNITSLISAYVIFRKLFGNRSTLYFSLTLIVHMFLNYQFISWMIKHRYSENERLNVVQGIVLEQFENRDLIIMTNEKSKVFSNIKNKYERYGNDHIKTSCISPILEYMTYITFYISGLCFIIFKIRNLTDENFPRVEMFVTSFITLQQIYHNLNYLGYIYQFISLTSANVNRGYMKDNKEVITKSGEKFDEIHIIALINYSHLQKEYILEIKNNNIAIIGPNGGGKTYFIESLLGFHHGKNEQFVNNTSYRLIDKNSFYSKISYCAGKLKILSGTIIENISFGTKIPHDKILEICSKVGFLKHLEELDNGINTVINNTTENISNGEKQMVCLLRTLVKTADIYIFDEPSSYLEISKIHMFLNYIHTYLKDKTVIIVTQDELLLNNFKFDTLLRVSGRVVSKVNEQIE